MIEPNTRFVGGPVQSTAARLADRSVKFLVGTAVDYAGVIRAKGVPIDRFPAFVEVGMGASPSWLVFCVDSGIAFTPDFGVIGDLRLRIDPAATTILDDGVAWAPADFHHQDGEPVRRLPPVAAAAGRRGARRRRAHRPDRRRAGVRAHPTGRHGPRRAVLAGLRRPARCWTSRRCWPT